MRFDELRRRLSRIPPRLPPPRRELVPLLLASPDGTLPPAPTWPASRRVAAVLALFHPDEHGETAVVLTERSAGGHRHAGQVSFPGGALDATDESVIAAALREAREEVGLDVEQAGVQVIAVLEPVDVRVSGFLAHPVLAVAEREPLLRPDPREVATVFSAPLSAFLPGAPIETIVAERDGAHLRYGAYRVGRHVVWGATAFMLDGLGRLLADAGD